MIIKPMSSQDHPRRPRRFGLGALVLGAALLATSAGVSAATASATGVSRGAAAGAPAATSTTIFPTITTTRPLSCDGVSPQVQVVSVGETSFEISYSLAHIPGCPDSGLTLELSTQDEFGSHPVQYTAEYPDASHVVITGLTPGTDYYWVARGGSTPFPSWGGPVHTLGTAPPQGPRCAATYQELSRWPGGFTARVTVANTSHVTVPGWSATWNWAQGEQIRRATGARVTGPANSPVLTGTGRRHALSDGETVTIDLEVRAPSPYATYDVKPVCTVTR
jgi:Cellulose binding domain/COBRA-like protein